MKDFVIVTDSCCDLPIEYVLENNVNVVSLTCNFDGKEYEDNLGKSLNPKEFYKGIREGIRAKTSQPSSDAFYSMFKKFAMKDINILYICVSSGLSGTINSATIAKNMLIEEGITSEIYILDILTASLGQGLNVIKACDLKANGKTFDEIINVLENEKQNVNTYMLVDDLIHLKRGGRISSAAAIVGMVLHIKPILTINHEGKVLPVLKVKGRKKAINTMAEVVLERIENSETNTICISHGDCEDEALKLKNLIMDKIKVKNFVISYIGPVVGTYGGPNALAISFCGKRRQHHIIE